MQTTIWIDDYAVRVFENKIFLKIYKEKSLTFYYSITRRQIRLVLRTHYHPTECIFRNLKLYINHFCNNIVLLMEIFWTFAMLDSYIGRRQDKWRGTGTIISQITILYTALNKRQGISVRDGDDVLFYCTLFEFGTRVYGLRLLSSERKRFETEYPFIWFAIIMINVWMAWVYIVGVASAEMAVKSIVNKGTVEEQKHRKALLILFYLYIRFYSYSNLQYIIICIYTIQLRPPQLATLNLVWFSYHLTKINIHRPFEIR